MKKRVLSFFLCLTYIVVLVGMLMLQVRRIDEEAERFMATVELMLLLLFCVGLVVLYMRGQKKLKNEKVVSDPERSNYVDNYDHFCGRIAEDGLSEREKEVAWLIYRGFTNRQIAEELFIAESTVKKHVSHILEKCDVSGRKELKERWRK